MKIVTDSCCDLSPELLDRYDITLVPMSVSIANKVYLDFVEMDQFKLFQLVQETGERSPYATRLKVVNNTIAEVETIVVRPSDAGIPFVTADIKPLPVWDEILTPALRSPRQKMIDLADGYFDTLQLNDGTVLTEVAVIIKEVNDASTAISSSIQEQGGITAQIAGQIADSNTSIVEINKAMEELSLGIREVSANIQGVSQVAQDSGKGVQQLSRAAADLSERASRLQIMVHKFRL